MRAQKLLLVGAFRQLEQLALQIVEQRTQIERVVEVVRQQLELQHLGVEIGRARLQVFLQDRSEHVLAQSRFRDLALAHQLGVETRVRVA